MTYTMKELAAKVGKTEQYIRKILKKERFSNLTEHIIRNDNTGRVVYDDVILEKLLEYFETISNKNLPEECIWDNFVIKFKIK